MKRLASFPLVLLVLGLCACPPAEDDTEPGTSPDDTGDTGVPSDEDPLVAEHATVAASEAITLVATVSWTTNIEASASVEFGPADGDYEYVVDYGDAGTEHQVHVVGMRPETTYKLRAVSTTAGGQQAYGEELSFTTGEVPYPWREMTIDIYDPSQAYNGWTLYNIATSHTTDAFAVMVDMEGSPVWYYHGGENGRADLVPKMVDGDHVLFGPAVPTGSHPVVVDMAGEVLWEGPRQDLGFADGGLHHVFLEREDGSYLLVEYTQDALGAMGDTILVYDQDLNLVWEWCTFDHVPDHPSWVHTNSVFLDEPNGHVYANSYMMGKTFKIDEATGDILWTFGEGGDFAPDPYAVEPFPFHAHAFSVLDNGNMLIYDNGDDERGYSRVVEFAIDDVNMSSEIVWQYPGTLAYDPWFCAAWGDVDRLPNGNTLINAGAGTNTPRETVSRIFEVTEDGEIVWEAWLHQSAELELGAYAADRYDPIAQPIVR